MKTTNEYNRIAFNLVETITRIFIISIIIFLTGANQANLIIKICFLIFGISYIIKEQALIVLNNWHNTNQIN